MAKRGVVFVTVQALAVSVGLGCVAPMPARLELPTGQGVFKPAVMASALIQLANRCSDDVTGWVGEASVKGLINGRRVDTRLAGVVSGGLVALERLGGRLQPVATYLWTQSRADGDGAVLLLRQSRRAYYSDDPAALLERMLGIRINPGDFAEVLRACHVPVRPGTDRLIDNRWLTMSFGLGRMFLRRNDTTGEWFQLKLAYPGRTTMWAWTVEYDDFREEFPRTLRFDGPRREDTHFDFRIERFQADVFTPSEFATAGIPDGYTFLTAAEMERIIPLEAE